MAAKAGAATPETEIVIFQIDPPVFENPGPRRCAVQNPLQLDGKALLRSGIGHADSPLRQSVLQNPSRMLLVGLLEFPVGAQAGALRLSI